MATLNLSTNGSSISKSYQSVVDAPLATGAVAASSTYGQWAVFTVSAPLVNAFQQGPGKESVLKVESTGEGELQDLVDEFSDGRIQFAFAKVKDPNTRLPKNVLIGWCGEGVPERTKGYFSSHQATVAKLLHAYHVQISARSDRDLTPESIIQKVSDASGARYTAEDKPAVSAQRPPVPAQKPVFTPSSSAVPASGFNPLAHRRAIPTKSEPTDADGWGEDAPPVVRTQLEKVQAAYKPTKVNISELTGQKSATTQSFDSSTSTAPDVVKGAYQPVGKVDIAAIRRQAKEGGENQDDRPAPVKGAYEPVGKVDIAAIRARAQPPPAQSTATGGSGSSFTQESARSQAEPPEPPSISAGPGRLAELPKPKVANSFGSTGNRFSATKAPVPGEFGLHSAAPGTGSTPMGAGRTFAESAVKSPAQLWAEKRAAQGITNESTDMPRADATTSQHTDGWKSGYGGKKWAAVDTGKHGTSHRDVDSSNEAVETGESQPQEEVQPDVGAIRAQFSQARNTGFDHTGPKEDQRSVPLPPPPAQPRSPSPADDDEADSGSPVRIAVPVARGSEAPVTDAHDEQIQPQPAIPVRSLEQQIDLQAKDEDEPSQDLDAGRGVAETVAVGNFGENAVKVADPGQGVGGASAVSQYDYEKQEDNEIDLREGDLITNIEMVDTDWWMGQNPQGESGLFPSAYVEVVEDNAQAASGNKGTEAPAPAAAAPPSQGKTATALYDYDAAEDNELSFPDGALIQNVEFPDDDWWSGEYGGMQGLFPANYVQLN